MKTIMKRFLICLLIIVSIYGCEKDNSVNYSSSLTGEWSWIFTCGGVVGLTWPSQNNTVNLLFTADSILYTYCNDTLNSYKTFHTYKRILDNGLDTADIIAFGFKTYKYYLYLDTLTLESLDFLYSGSVYKRIKQLHFP